MFEYIEAAPSIVNINIYLIKMVQKKGNKKCKEDVSLEAKKVGHKYLYVQVNSS